jgi:outer membrane protein OmpA-like peptidoglycan-associated protein
MKITADLRFLFGFFIFSCQIAAQNLVPNPGFEQYKKIPVTFCYTAKEFSASVKDWTTPNEATADYFHAKCKANVSTIKKNFAGFQKAEEGQAYVGIYCCMGQGSNYSEYIKTKLIKPLKAGQKYIVQFYVSLSEASEYAVDRLGVLFRKDNLVQKNLFPLNYNATAESPDSVFYDDKIKWRQVRLSFTATGGEKYMIIGNFHASGDTHLKKVPVNKKKYYKENGCYYYLDDVCLAEENEDGNCFCPLAPIDSTPIPIVQQDSVSLIQATLKKPVILNFVFFDSNEAILKPESFPSLDTLAVFLNEEQKYFISIVGYTDNSGDEQKNQKLSEARAKAVADYLISKGISPFRVGSGGKGSADPVSDNSTPEGRAKNRRVEYTLEL